MVHGAMLQPNTILIYGSAIHRSLLQANLAPLVQTYNIHYHHHIPHEECRAHFQQSDARLAILIPDSAAALSQLVPIPHKAWILIQDTLSLTQYQDGLAQGAYEILTWDESHRLPQVVLHAVRALQTTTTAHSTLQTSLARYQAIIEDQLDLICRFTPDFRLTFTNRAYAAQYDKTPEELLGTSFLERIHEAERPIAIEHVQRLSLAQPVQVSEHCAVLPDGTLRWQQWVDRAFFDEYGNIIEYQGVGRDIHERKLAQDRLDFLHRLVLNTSTATSVHEALAIAMQSICEMQAWDYGEIWLYDAQQKHLNCGATRYIQPSAYEGLNAFHASTQHYRFALGEGIPGYVWLSKSVLWIHDIQAYSPQNFFRLEEAQQAGIHGLVALPIVNEAEVLAVLIFMALRPLPPDADSHQLLVTALQQIAPLIRLQHTLEALKLSEERYKSLIESSDTLIATFDYEGRTLFMNHRAIQRLGLSDQEIHHKSLLELFSADEAHFLLKHIRKIIDSHQGANIESSALFSDGRHWFRISMQPVLDISGKPYAVIVNAIDITERKQTEDALRQSEARQRALLNALPDMMFRLDVDGVFLDFHTPSEEDLLVSSETLIGRKIQDILPPDVVQKQLSATQQVLATGKGIEYTYQLSIHGEENDFEARLMPVNDAEVIVIIRNVTERKQAEKALQEAHDLLEQRVAERTAELEKARESLRQALEQEKELSELKSRFVSTTSHEFRTPLAVILSTSETLAMYRHRLTDEQIDERLAKIRQQVMHMRDILEDVLHLERIRARRIDFKPTVLHIPALCQDIINEFDAQTIHHERIQYHCEHPDIIALCDERLLRHIITNFISNALKYSEVHQPVQIYLSQEAEQFILCIQDQGIGIPAKDRKHLFEPFHRATNVGTISGTGLGLSIAKQAVEMHQGTIELNSQEGMGTQITVRIPLRPSHP